jgi:hypothetical protein
MGTMPLNWSWEISLNRKAVAGAAGEKVPGPGVLVEAEIPVRRDAAEIEPAFRVGAIEGVG